MLKATEEQREQVQHFFYLINEEVDNILLHPVIDQKDLKERLAICIVDRDTGEIFMLGLWFLPEDTLFKRFEFKQLLSPVLLKKPPGKIVQFFQRLYNRIWKY